MRKLAVLAVAVLVIAGGCGSDKKAESGGEGGSTPTTEATKGAQTYTVGLDPKVDAFNAEVAGFFPGELSVHPGDKVSFEVAKASGVPHTVTLGTLVDAGVAKLEQLGPQASFAAQEDAPEVLKLPDVFPHGVPQGPPAANQSAAQPCFLDSGVPPLALAGGAPACPKRAQPAFTGEQSFYNLGGVMKDGDKVSLDVAPTTKPGTYRMICLIHRGVMTGKLTVAPASAAVPSPADVKAKARQQLADMVKDASPVATAAQAATPDKAHEGTLVEKFPSLVVADFGPKTVSVPVGGTVSWTLGGFHTLSFNAAESDVGAVAKAPDGSFSLVPKAGIPVGFEVAPEVGAFPPPEGVGPVTVDLGSYDGAGFRNTGVIGSLPPALVTFKVKFTKAGTFPVRCLIHTDMKGDVKVA